MKGFHLRKSPPLWKIMRQEQAVEKQEKAPPGAPWALTSVALRAPSLSAHRNYLLC